MSIPTKDALLATWSDNFLTRGQASPATFGLDAAQLVAYEPLHDAFVLSYQAASAIGARSKSLVADKEAKKLALLDYARELYGYVAASQTVSDANKVLIGVHVRATPTPQPAPQFAPTIDVKSVDSHTVEIRLHDSETGKRAKPKNCLGATIFSFTGENPPVNVDDWKFEASVTKTLVKVVFPSELEPGTKVFLTAFWFNRKAESSPAAEPASALIGFGLQQTGT